MMMKFLFWMFSILQQNLENELHTSVHVVGLPLTEKAKEFLIIKKVVPVYEQA